MLNVLGSLSLFWAEVMINQKGFKKSLMHAYISRLYITLSCTLLYSLLIFFKCKVPSENERYRNCKGHWAECLLFSQWRKYYRSLILAAKRKQEDSHWSKITRAFLREEKTKISQLNDLKDNFFVPQFCGFPNCLHVGKGRKLPYAA